MSGFKINDSAVFVIEENGTRHIENFAVLPFNDNFDFDSDALVAKTANYFLRPRIDAWKIGRTVSINFDASLVPRIDYTDFNYSIDNIHTGLYSHTSGENVEIFIGLASEFIGELWNNGTNRFVASDGRAIIYGSDDKDTLRASDIDLLPFGHRLKAESKNGVNIVAGKGDDKLHGSKLGDHLFGGDGNDNLVGGGGNDTLEGGAGYDKYYFNDDGQTSIKDSDGTGQVIFNGLILTGGKGKTGSNSWISANKLFVYKLAGTTLTVNNNLTIKDFQNGKLGIILHDDEPPSPPKKIADSYNNAARWQPRRDPLIIDLDGNGLDTIGIDGANPILFDHDNDGIKTATGWVKPQDGFLVLDRNGNGTIDSGAELFGDSTQLSSGGKASDGFAALKDLDSNTDGKVDAGDSAWGQLRVWRDLNQDGISQADELFRLDQIGITSFDVAKRSNSVFLPNGNQVADLGTYTRTDGKTGTLGEVGQVADVNLIEDTFTSKFTDHIALTPGVDALPEMNGSGQVRNIQEAASIDSDAGRALKAKLTVYANAKTYTEQKNLLQDLIVAWAATSNMATSFVLSNDPNFKGGSVIQQFAHDQANDFQKIDALEKFNGSNILTKRVTTVASGGYSLVLENERLALLDASWNALSSFVYETLLIQTRMKSLLAQFDYVDDSTGKHLDNLKAKNYFESAIATGSIDAVADLIDFNRLVSPGLVGVSWDGSELLTQFVQSASMTPDLKALFVDKAVMFEKNTFGIFNGTSVDEVIVASTGNDALYGNDGNDILFGSDGEDMLNGDQGSDYLHGGTGYDTLNGGDGDDTLDGGAGNDFLIGGKGNDIYIWGRGSGKDQIYNYNFSNDELDVIQIGPGVRPEDIIVLNDGKNLTLKIKGTDDALNISDAFNQDGIDARGMVTEIHFADGTSWDLSKIESESLKSTDGGDMIYGTNWSDIIDGGSGNDIIYSHDGNDAIIGGAGSDSLFGENGDDTIIGGAGDDVLNGGDGDDAYIFASNWGSDRIDGTEGSGRDVIRFAEDISPSGIKLSISGDSLFLEEISTGSKIEVNSIFKNKRSDDSLALTQVEFSDGTVWDINTLLQAKLTGDAADNLISGTSLDEVLTGNAGRDTLDGGGGNDTLAGGLGNDILRGGLGDDTYLISSDGGDDYIFESSYQNKNGGNDSIVFGADIKPGDIRLHRVPTDVTTTPNSNIIDDLLIVNTVTGQEIRVGDYFSTTEDMAIENIVFQDGTAWDRAAILARLVDRTGTPSTMSGTAEDDIFVIDHPLDEIKAGVVGGNDKVVSSVTYTLPDYAFVPNVRVFELTGNFNINATGNAGSNVIKGNSGNNTLHGGYSTQINPSPDTLIGGAGDDTYIVKGKMTRDSFTLDILNSDNLADTVIENANEGTDTIITDAYHVDLPDNVENLTVSGNAYFDNRISFKYVTNKIVGNSLNNVIDASGITGGIQRIDGGVGADTMIGGTGNDIFVVDNIGDVVVDRLLNSSDADNISPSDSVEASVSYTLGKNIENLVLTGTAQINGTGNDLNNVLDGSVNSSVNHLYGGKGDDRYIVGAGDVVHENAGEGSDTVSIANTPEGMFSLASYQNIENIALEDSSGASKLTGDAGSNTITGNASNNELFGGDGNDIIYDNSNGGRRGERDTSYLVNDSDLLSGGLGNDKLVSYGGMDTLDGGAGDDELIGGKGPTKFVFGLGYGHDVITSDAGDWAGQYDDDEILLKADIVATDLQLNRSGQTLQLQIRGTQDVIEVANFFTDDTAWTTNNTIEGLRFADGSYWDLASILARVQGGNVNTATANGDVLTGNAGNDTFDGLAGDDVMRGDAGNDLLTGGADNDLVFGGTGNDTLTGGTGNDLLIGGAGADVYKFSRGFGVDIIEEVGNPSATELDVIEFGADIAVADVTVEKGVDASESTIIIKIKGTSDQLTLRDQMFGDKKIVWTQYSTYANGVELVKFADGTVWTAADLLQRAQVMNGTEQADTLTGDMNNNVIMGLGGNDTIDGSDGDDTLDGGSGIDQLIGGNGNDTFVVDNTADIVKEGSEAGTDTIMSSVTYTLPANVEKLTLTGTAAINGTGNTLNNVITGNAGNNTLSGGTGADTMIGGAGNDTYIVDNVADVVTELAGEGNDTVQSSVSYTLLANVEALTLTGTNAINGTGNNIANTLTGNSANNVLDGGDGADTLIGGAGNDTLIGGDGDDVIDGGAGDDELRGGAGFDTYKFGKNLGNDTITDGDSANKVQRDVVLLETGIKPADVTLKREGTGANITLALSIAGVSNVLRIASYFNGTELNAGMAQSIQFADGTVWNAETIKTMTAGPVNHAPVLATPLADQTAGQGVAFNYTVPANAFTDTDSGDLLTYSATLADGSALPAWLQFNASTRVFSGTPTATGTISVKVTVKDKGSLSTSDVFDLAVNVQNQTLNGTSGADTLNGGAGNDTLNGLAGNDKLSGNAGNDTLDGGAGNDTLVGGLGDDTYIVDSATDVVTENSGEGTDLVKSSVTFILPANVENLTLTGTTAINGTGNALANTITGNSGNNVLDGAAGADTLIGGAGNDTYVVDDAADVVTENAKEGTDLVQSSVTYTLAANLENLTLTGTAAINGTGNALANIITGNSANNLLDGGAGADTLIGGKGNDTYVVDNTADIVTENAIEGTDLVQSSVTYTLAANVENLTLTGTTAINGTGNALGNIITGNSANNVLDGAGGADTLVGGAGNDIYIVDNTAEVITEAASEGVDQVQSSVSFTLAANIEALYLTGTTAINGTGNAIDNLLVGNSGNNTLNGAGGNDILQGGAGTDTLTDTVGNNLFDGGAGNDTITGGTGNELFIGGTGSDTITTSTGADVIAFNLGDGSDIVNSSTGKDNTVSLGKGIKYADLQFKKNGNDLILVTGASDQITFKDWYANTTNHNVANLQIVIEGTSDYNSASTNKLNNKKIEQFNFDGLVSKFDQARAAQPSLTSWALSASLLEFYLSGSDTAAIGGDFAYQYAKNGNLSNFSLTPAQAVLNNAQFGTASQTLQPVGNLKDLTAVMI